MHKLKDFTFFSLILPTKSYKNEKDAQTLSSTRTKFKKNEKKNLYLNLKKNLLIFLFLKGF